MTFDSETLAQLRRTTWVRTIIYREVIGSTNDYALRHADDPTLKLPLLVLADRQTTGRGRGANRWWSPPGALLFSVLLDASFLLPQASAERSATPRSDSNDTATALPGADEQNRSTRPTGSAAGAPASSISLVTGLAVCEAIQQLVPALAVGIKWPNDVLVDNRKLAGILVEVPPGRPDRMVIGIGINVNNQTVGATPELARQAISLVEAARYRFSLVDVLQSVLWQLAEHFRQLATDKSQLAERWQQLCVLTDKRVEVRVGRHLVAGLCQGVNDAGELLVQTADGVRVCSSGTVTRYEQQDIR